MQYALSHDGSRIKVELEGGKFTTFPKQPGLNLGLMIYSVFSPYGIKLKDIEPLDLTEIPEFLDKLTLGTPDEKHPDSQI